MNHHKQKRLLTADEIEVRIWAIVVLCVTLILMFIVVALIYRTTFVTQPMKQPSPMDMADQKMLNDIVLLIVGGIGGIMGRKGVKAAAEMIAAVQKPANLATLPQYPSFPMAPNPTMAYGSGSPYPAPAPVVVDVNWTPPPPPTNPPHHLEDPDERQAMAAARETTRGT